MMKKQALLIFAVLLSFTAFTQSVGIGTRSPESSAQLDVSSTTKGMLVPRMTMTQRDEINRPATGLLIFQTDNTAGFYYYTGSSWKPMFGGGFGLYWGLMGNSGTDSLTNFVGTTDNKPLVFRINNSRAGFLGNNGNIFWGKGSGMNNTTGVDNTAIGTGALFTNTDRSDLVAIGDSALFHNGLGAIREYGRYNTAVGSKALFNNTLGFGLTAIGYESMLSNVSGYYNSAYGYQTLYSNISGNANTANGYQALHSNTSGSYNTANGYLALYANTIGNDNTANGYGALHSNTKGQQNTAVGSGALFNMTGGYYNTATGYRALFSNLGSFNTAYGRYALYSNTKGYINTAIGVSALHRNTIGNSNTAFGAVALSENISGDYNTAVGNSTLGSISTSDYNTAIGEAAGNSYNLGNSNTFLGAYSDANAPGLTFCIAIGTGAISTASHQARIGNSTTTSIGGPVGWTTFSDGRFKRDIKENVQGLDFIMRLRPVTYHLNVRAINQKLYKGSRLNIDSMQVTMKQSFEERENMLETGFIAQEVEKAAQLTGFDFSGIDKPGSENDFYGLRYAQFVVPLVKAVQEQQVIIEELSKQVERSEIPAIVGKQQQIIEELKKQVEQSEIPAIVGKQQVIIEELSKQVERSEIPAIVGKQQQIIEQQNNKIEILVTQMKEMNKKIEALTQQIKYH